MPYHDTMDETRIEAIRYAEDLVNRREATDVTVYHYRTSIDNIPEEYRNHREVCGYAVRFTQQEPQSPRTGAPFHDRSLVVFTEDAPARHAVMLPDRFLIDDGAVIADIPGEEVTPYWVGWYTSPDSRDPVKHPENCHLPHVGLKRHTAHTAGAPYAFHTGPKRTFHLILEPVGTDRTHQRGNMCWSVTEDGFCRIHQAYLAEADKHLQDMHGPILTRGDLSAARAEHAGQCDNPGADPPEYEPDI